MACIYHDNVQTVCIHMHLLYIRTYYMYIHVHFTYACTYKYIFTVSVHAYVCAPTYVHFHCNCTYIHTCTVLVYA